VIRKNKASIQNEERILRKRRRATSQHTEPTSSHYTQTHRRTPSLTALASEAGNLHRDRPAPIQGEPNQMANTTQDIPMFYGDEDQDKDEPQMWLRKLERACGKGATEETLMWTFEKSLEPGGRAEEWFNELTPAEKATWKETVKAFKKEWPMEKRLELTRDERRRKLLDIKLKKEDLREKVGEEGKKRWSHVEWADKVKRAAKAAGDTQGFLIPQALDNLPKLIRRLLPGQDIEDDWDKFTEAVKEIPLRKIEEALEDEKQNEEVTNTMARLLAGTTIQSHEPNPTTGRYANQITNHTYQRFPSYTPMTTRYNAQRQQIPNPQHQANRPQATPAQPQTPGNGNDPFAGNATLRPNNIMYGYRNPQVSPLAERPGAKGKSFYDLAVEAVMNSVSQSRTEESWKRYEAAMKTWIEVHGEGPANYMTQPLPLTPGTAKLGSGECFRCGKVTDPAHRGAECHDQPIPPRESNWRAYVARAYNQGRARIPTQFNTPAPTQQNLTTPIHMINVNAWDVTEDYDPHIYDSAKMYFEEEGEQGNGEESH
jgi:hypothetical protein